MPNSIPIDQLFGPARPIAPVVTPAPVQPKQPNQLATWVVIGMAAILLYFTWQGMDRGDGKDDGGKRDDQGQKEETSVPSSFLLFLHERSPLTAEQADTLGFAAEFCEANPKFSWRSWDDDDDTEAVVKAKAYAKEKGIDPPCVVVKTQDGSKLIKAAPWPKSKADIERLVK